MIDFNITLASNQVLLRPIESADFDEMKTLTANPDMWTYFTSDLSIEAELKIWIESAVSARANKQQMAFTIVDAKSSQIIGSTRLGSISTRDERLEIGWTWVSEQYQGKGFNAQAKSLMLKYCFEECNAIRVEFKTDVLNIPARKALKKMGIIEEGILRSHTQMIKNRRRDTIFYSVLSSEWEEIKQKNDW